MFFFFFIDINNRDTSESFFFILDWGLGMLDDRFGTVLGIIPTRYEGFLDLDLDLDFVVIIRGG